MKLEFVDCNLCGNKKSVPYVRVQNVTNLNIKYWQVVKCPNCGLLYTNPRLSIEDVTRLYQAEYNTPRNPKLFQRLILSIKKWKVYFFRRIDGKKGDAVLDVGCGDGYFLIACKSKGYQVMGLDLDEQFSKEIGKKYNIKVLAGQLSTTLLESASFDHITMHHMLEHSYDPMEDLKTAHRLLKRNGKLYIEVPNMNNIEVKVKQLRNMPFHWSLPFHTYHFNKETITAYLSKAGFKILSVSYPIFSPNVFSRSIIHLIKKDIKPNYENILIIFIFPFILPFAFLVSLFGKTPIIGVKAIKK